MIGKGTLSCTLHEWPYEIFNLALILWAFVGAVSIEIVKKTYNRLLMRSVSRLEVRVTPRPLPHLKNAVGLELSIENVSKANIIE